MFDVIIKNARIIDGTGKPGFRGDVGVLDGKIVQVGKVEGEAGLEADATGLTLSPGFIDSHGHSDRVVLDDPLLACKLEQGITTELAGQCGGGPAPSGPDRNNRSGRYYPDFGSFVRELERTSLGINLALFVPHGAVRAAVMGYENRRPAGQELDRMRALILDGMESGALGMSSGLAYIPGLFSDQREITELSRVVAQFGGTYVSHMRNQADRLVESVKETIQVGRDTGCKVAISHHKAMGPDNWGKTRQTVELIDHAAAEELHVINDVYPYTANSTTLLNALPPRELAGGPSAVVERLRDKEYRKYVREQIFNPTQQWDNNVKNVGYGKFLITRAPKTPEAQGKFLTEYAECIGLDPFDALTQLLIENETRVSVSIFNMCEEDILTVIGSTHTSIGTDGVYTQGEKVVHPRAFGTFPRFLGRYVRERKVMPLEEAIRRITSLPAEFYSLRGKGLIREGYDADITVFDPETILDKSDFKNPFAGNEGVEYVFVAGKLAVRRNKNTGARAGGVLKRGVRQAFISAPESGRGHGEAGK